MIHIIQATEKPLTLIGSMASTCWDSKPKSLRETGIKCINSGHGRLAEFPDIIIEITGYSNRVIRELYTHHIGVTRLQQSTRYVDCSDFDYYIPDSVLENPSMLQEYNSIHTQIQNVYSRMLANGIPKQDCANVLPLSMHTKVVLKINVRALMHMANLRMCERALLEYRQLMCELKKVLSEIDDEWSLICDKYLIPKCESAGYCAEEHSCGLYPKK